MHYLFYKLWLCTYVQSNCCGLYNVIRTLYIFNIYLFVSNDIKCSFVAIKLCDRNAKHLCACICEINRNDQPNYHVSKERFCGVRGATQHTNYYASLIFHHTPTHSNQKAKLIFHTCECHTVII